MSRLITHSAVRLYPTAVNGDRWLAANLASCVEFRCSRIATALLIAFIDGDSRPLVCDLLSDRLGIDTSIISSGIDRLEQLGLLVPPDHLEHLRFQRLFKNWNAWGWVDAADYHVATLNYPFADYRVDGRSIDAARMAEYVSEQPDIHRAKSIDSPLRRIPAPTTIDSLSQLDENFRDAWEKNYDLEQLSIQKILLLMSTVFGRLRTRKLAIEQNLMADAIGKTSPSGGSRHPTEAYLFSWNIAGLDSGIYHFNVLQNSLDKIDNYDDGRAQRQALFSGPLRASFNVDAVVVMTSVFERSMYRYREPRSFRAPYIDVGHLAGTMDITAKALRINCLVQHGLDDRAVSKRLKLDPLQEGIIYGAAIGGSCIDSLSGGFHD